MIVKLILFAALVTSPVLGSAIKGYREEAPPAKGQRVLALVEQQRVLVEQQQTKKLESTIADKKEELREEQQQQQIQLAHEPQQKLDDLKQEQEPLVQKLEELPPPPTKRYEAKSQVTVVRQEQELAKGQAQQQKVIAIEQTQTQRLEEAPKAPLELQKPIEVVERVEQVQRDTSSQDSQQVELHEEQQHRYEAVTEQRHQQEEIQQVEELQQQQVHYPVKGQQQQAAAAPLGQAEPYAFEYQVEGSSRRESGDVNGVVRGQYTLQGSDGSSRIVDYVADANGFRASVNTNEFGTEARSPAGVELRSSQPEAQDISLRLEGKTRESLQAPAPQAPPAGGIKSAAQIPENWRATKGQVAAQPAIVAQPQLALVAVAAPAPAPAPEQPAEAPRVTPLATKSQYPLKTHEPIIRAPAKGELDDKLQQPQQQQQQVELIGQAAGQLESIDRRAPSAEYRAPKTLIRVAPVQPARVGFESATAHRNRAPVAVVDRRPVHLAAPPPPAVPIIGVRPVVAPVRTHLRQAPATRGHYYQADRHYPSSSISAIPSGYRRQVVQPLSSASLVASGDQHPRSYSVDDDSLNASFDRSA